MNKGLQEVKPWDRNEITIVNSDGVLKQQYTKIYDNDGGAASTTLSMVTTDNAAAVAAGSRGVDYNSLQLTPGGASLVWNAVDRFRPRQEKQFDGWFALFDASYDIVPENLTFVFGTGWVSGELSKDTSVNDLDAQSLMNQEHKGFVPLQSVYSGTRLRHLVMINAGIPRVSKKQPWESSANQNVITSINGKETLSGMSNLSFIGGNLEWKVESFKKYKLQLSPNLIHYWSPDSPYLSDGTTLASSSLGTELTLEVSARIFDRIKLYSYGGVFFPGKQYTQLKEANVVVDKVILGDAPAYVINIGATFAF